MPFGRLTLKQTRIAKAVYAVCRPCTDGQIIEADEICLFDAYELTGSSVG